MDRVQARVRVRVRVRSMVGIIWGIRVGIRIMVMVRARISYVKIYRYNAYLIIVSPGKALCICTKKGKLK